MTLSLIKPAGWAFGELLTSAQMEALDASQARAIDGTGGGTYTPSTRITINGPGLQVTSLTVTGTLSLLGNTTIGNSPTDSLLVQATSTFAALVTLNDDFTVQGTSNFFGDVFVHAGGTFEAPGDVDIGDGPGRSLTVLSTSSFSAPVTFNDTVECWENVSIHSGAYFHAIGDVKLGNSPSNTLEINGSLISVLTYGAGRVPLKFGRVISGGTDLVASDGQLFRIDTFVSGNFQVNLRTTGAVDGDVMIFYTGAGTGPTHDVTVKNAVSGDQLIFVHNTSGFACAGFVFESGYWHAAIAINVGIPGS